MSATDDHGIEALHAFVGGTLVFLADGPPRSDRALGANGSGTLLRTPRGAHIVLTAKHVLEDDPPRDGFSMGGPEPTQGPRAMAIGNALKRHWSHPSADVAVALISSEASNLLGHHALPTEVVAPSRDDEVSDQVVVIAAGFPAAYRFHDVDHEARVVRQSVPRVSYVTSVQGLDRRGRYCVLWDEGIMQDLSLPRSTASSASAAPMRHPGGISGGALWRFNRLKRDALWAPVKAGTLIGVLTSWDKVRTEYAESVRTWGDWFLETVSEIDKAGGG